MNGRLDESHNVDNMVRDLLFVLLTAQLGFFLEEKNILQKPKKLARFPIFTLDKATKSVLYTGNELRKYHSKNPSGLSLSACFCCLFRFPSFPCFDCEKRKQNI